MHQDEKESAASIRQASEWLIRCEEGDEHDWRAFVEWLKANPAHAEWVMKLEALRASIRLAACTSPFSCSGAS